MVTDYVGYYSDDEEDDDYSDDYCYLCGVFLTDLDFEHDAYDEESGRTICRDCDAL